MRKKVLSIRMSPSQPRRRFIKFLRKKKEVERKQKKKERKMRAEKGVQEKATAERFIPAKT